MDHNYFKTILKLLSCVILLLIFFLPTTNFFDFLTRLVLYLTLTNLIIYWDFGYAIIKDFKLVQSKKESVLLNLIAISSFILLTTIIYETFVPLPNFLMASLNTSILYLGFFIFVFGLINVYIIRFANLKRAWKGSTAATSEKIVTTGYYRFIRHPIYFFSYFMFGGLGLFLNTWWTIIASAIIVICYSQLGKCDEINLENNIEYQRYKLKVPYSIFGYMMPSFYRRKKNKNKNK